MGKKNAAQKLAIDLTALAKAATPGPWITDGDYINEHNNVLYSYIASGRKRGGRIANTFANCLVKTDEQCRANAAFIAGANPKAILVLTAEIDRLTAACAKAEQIINTESKAGAFATGRANLLETENERLRKGLTNVFSHVEGNTECLVRDLVNWGTPRINPNDFYTECEAIKAIASAALKKEVATPSTNTEDVSRHEGGQT